MKQTLQNLVAEGKTKKVLEELKELTQSKVGLQKELILINARFTELEKKTLLDIEESRPLSIERNKINHALLELIDRLDSGEDNHAISETPTPTIIQNAEKIYKINHIDNANFS